MQKIYVEYYIKVIFNEMRKLLNVGIDLNKKQTREILV